MRCLPGFALVLTACGSPHVVDGPLVFEEAALATALGTSQRLSVSVHARVGAPPARGVNVLQLRVRSALDGGVAARPLTLTVTPYMPAHGHGASTVPTVTETDGGEFVVGELSLPMPGTWELRTSMTGSVSDEATPTLEIP